MTKPEVVHLRPLEHASYRPCKTIRMLPTGDVTENHLEQVESSSMPSADRAGRREGSGLRCPIHARRAARDPRRVDHNHRDAGSETLAQSLSGFTPLLRRLATRSGTASSRQRRRTASIIALDNAQPNTYDAFTIQRQSRGKRTHSPRSAFIDNPSSGPASLTCANSTGVIRFAGGSRC